MSTLPSSLILECGEPPADPPTTPEGSAQLACAAGDAAQRVGRGPCVTGSSSLAGPQAGVTAAAAAASNLQTVTSRAASPGAAEEKHAAGGAQAPAPPPQDDRPQHGKQLPDLERTLTALDVPPRPGRLGPRVEHFLVPRDCRAVTALQEMLGLPRVRTADGAAPLTATALLVVGAL